MSRRKSALGITDIPTSKFLADWWPIIAKTDTLSFSSSKKMSSEGGMFIDGNDSCSCASLKASRNVLPTFKYPANGSGPITYPTSQLFESQKLVETGTKFLRRTQKAA
jgi:hypothetical protein